MLGSAALRAKLAALHVHWRLTRHTCLPARPGADPTKLAKRRHQIGSLYHYAKQKELEQMEVRAQGSKSKAETKKKYGW